MSRAASNRFLLWKQGRSSVAAVLVLFGASGAAWADCNADMAGLMNKRMAEIQALNTISKAHGGKLDPIAACPRLRSLSAVEGEVLAYMQKNKDWCNLPDEMVTNFTAARTKDEGFATKACGLAVKFKQMQVDAQKQAQQAAQQQQEQAIKLPTGPL